MLPAPIMPPIFMCGSFALRVRPRAACESFQVAPQQEPIEGIQTSSLRRHASRQCLRRRSPLRSTSRRRFNFSFRQTTFGYQLVYTRGFEVVTFWWIPIRRQRAPASLSATTLISRVRACTTGSCGLSDSAPRYPAESVSFVVTGKNGTRAVVLRAARLTSLRIEPRALFAADTLHTACRPGVYRDRRDHSAATSQPDDVWALPLPDLGRQTSRSTIFRT